MLRFCTAAPEVVEFGDEQRLAARLVAKTWISMSAGPSVSVTRKCF
jgi:hypothetical protein